MIINRAIISTDDNPLYYEFWPLAANGWRNAGIEPTNAVIGTVNLDHSLGTIIRVPEIDGISSAFIAQVIRFIVPCLFPEEVSVVGDIDMIPLSKSYFTTDLKAYGDDKIIVFSSDAYKNELRYPMCYIAGKGKYFQEIIGLENTSFASIELFIKKLHGLNLGWDTDELFFAKKLHESVLFKQTILLKREGWQPFASNRIDRGNWNYSRWKLYKNKYIDAHALRPLHSHLTALKDIITYIEQGSDGRKYIYHLQKRPFKYLQHCLLMLKQKVGGRRFLEIKTVLGRDKAKKKIISFSLYGNNPRYFARITDVLSSYQTLLPEWKCRIYAAADLDPAIIAQLVSKNCEVYLMEKGGIDARYMNWRFLVIDDKDGEAFLIRDIDSFCSVREKEMIGQWLNSHKRYHIIRDHIYHNARIMGGLWGAKKNSLRLQARTKDFLFKNHYGSDQEFLCNIVYPLIKDDVIIHDSYPRYPDENVVVIPIGKNEPYIGEIGTDDDLSGNSRQQEGKYILLR